MTTLVDTSWTNERTWTDDGVPAREALAALPVGVLVCTAAGTWTNAAFRQIWRRSGDGPLTCREIFRALAPLEDERQPRRRGRNREHEETPLTVALAGRSAARERYRLTRDDGTVAVVSVEAEPLPDRDETAAGAVVLVRDETASHDAERLRDAFLGILGHELRTPITSIVGGAHLLGSGALAPDVREEVAIALVDEADRLDGLVDQLLRLAALDRRGMVVAEPIHLVHVVRRVILRERRRLPRLKIELRADDQTAAAVGDEGFVSEVVAILLDNAAKYAGGASRLIVQVNQRDGAIGVHVLDNGPGLPAGGSDVLFRLFQRGRGSDRRTGMGVGLFVARAIVEAMGGRIWAEDRAEGGADVGFSLPIAAE